MCSETSEAVGTTWEHAQLEFQKFLKIRITLLGGTRQEHLAVVALSVENNVGVGGLVTCVTFSFKVKLGSGDQHLL